MLNKVDDEVIEKVINLTRERSIIFINIQKKDDDYYIEYETGTTNNSKKIIDILSCLQKFKYAIDTDTLNDFYLYYDIGKDELITNFSTTVGKRSQKIVELIHLLEGSKSNIVKRVGPVKVASGKKKIPLAGRNVVNALIESLKESLEKEKVEDECSLC